MKNKYSLCLFIILAIGISCSHTKTNQADNVPLDSIIVDFYKYKGEEPDSLPNGYLPYPLLGITCATLQDVVNKYGECTNIEVSKDVDLNGRNAPCPSVDVPSGYTITLIRFSRDCFISCSVFSEATLFFRLTQIGLLVPNIQPITG